MSGLSKIKSISNRFKNFILATAFVTTQLITPTMLSGSAAAAGAITFGSQFQNQAYPDDPNTWTTGQLDNYSEGDYVNFRFQLTASSATSAGTMQVEYDLGGCHFFTNYFDFVSASPNIATITEGTNTLSGSGNNQYYAQKLNVSFNTAGTITVIFTLQLSNTAGECSGSNTGVRLNVPSTGSGDFANAGAKTLPMSANQVKENPSLTITKTVSSGDASPDDFYFTVSPAITGIINGTAGTWSEIHLTNGTVTIDEVNPDGQFVITEHGPDGYSFASGSGTSCSPTSSGVMTATVTADPNTPVDAICNFTNTRSMGNLKVVKDVVNDNGGTKTYADFHFSVNGGANQSFDVTTSPDGAKTLSLPTGSYTVTEPEANTMGYSTNYNNCTNVSVVAGQMTTCTITNNDTAPSLTLNKIVVNNNGGAAGEGAWTLNATGSSQSPTNLSGSGAAGSTDVVSGSDFKADTYTLGETGGPAGYAASAWTCTNGVTVNGNNQITLANGQTTVCSITNDDIAPTLTLRKVVVNPYGGTGVATADLWTLKAQHESDNPLVNMTGTLNSDSSASTTSTAAMAGVIYDLSETGPTGYDPSNWSCTTGGTVTDGDQVMLDIGKNVTCTITNTQKPASISGFKYEVDAEGNGTKPVANWTVYLLISGNPISTTTNGSGYYEFTGLAWGNYSLAECLNVSDGCDTWTQIYTPPAVTVNGENLTSDNNNFGNFQNGSISGYKFNDLNGDGVKQAEEPKIADWPFSYVFDANDDGAFDEQATNFTTSQDGNFSLSDLAPGKYQICENPQTELGWVRTAPASSDCRTRTIADSGQTITGVVFGNQARGTIKVVKDVVNDNGNTGTYQDFSFQLSSNDAFDNSVDVTGSYNFEQNGSDPNDGAKTIMQVPAGTYSVIEPEANTMGYATSYGNCANIVIAAGQTVTCTITNDDTAPGLTLNKIVVNNNGGQAHESDWTLTATGSLQAPTNLSGSGAVGDTDVASGSSFKADTYTLSERGGPSGYAASAWTCTNNMTVNENNQITLANGQTTVCSVTNDDIAPTLTLKKVVVNNNGGTATKANFQASENAQNVDWDAATTVDANAAYTLAETVLPGGEGYDASDWVCDGGMLLENQIVLGLDEDVTCTITNDDIAPELTVVKYVNNNGTNLTKTASDFTMNVAGTNVSDASFPGSQTGTTVSLDAGEYAVTEDNDSDYTVNYSEDCTGIIAVGAERTCYVYNEAIRNPAIHVEKDGPATAKNNQTITYTFTVTNPGNVPLNEVTVSDDVAGDGAVLQSGDVSNLGWLDPGETWIYTVNYTVPAGQSGNIVNTVTVCGEENTIEVLLFSEAMNDEQDHKVCDTDTHTTRIVKPHVLGASTELPNTGQSPLVNFVSGLVIMDMALAVRWFGRKSSAATL